MLRTLSSTHTILSVADGEFVSLLDPPEELREAAAACQNVGAWPVLVGAAGERDTMLASPIILYDYPQIAPESAGDMFDGTEIDEMLTLRIMLLTDAEKREMCEVDERARQILERTEMLPPEQLWKMHGAVRGLRPAGRDIAMNFDPWDPLTDRPQLASVRVSDVEIRPGDRVRLWPLNRADIMDMALRRPVGDVEAIEQDFEDHVHLAVVVDDDPGRDLGLARHIGHRFFFSPEEVEPLPAVSRTIARA